MEGGDLLTITVLILAHLIIGQSTMLLHYYPSGVSWDSAVTECGQHGLENDQLILRSISDLEGKTFWIGEKEETRECVCLRDRGDNTSFENCINKDMSGSFFVYNNFSDSSFVSDSADGKNCMTSSCTNTKQVHFVKAYCNSKEISVRGECDFSDNRFVSDPADGTNCMTSSCAYKGHVNFVKVYCNSTDDSVQGLCEDGSPAITNSSSQFWNLAKSVIMERCGRKHKLLPSSSYCKAHDNYVWTSVFRVEEDFEIETDDAGNYKPIGCVAATLNNSVLYKRRIPCDDTVNYFVCRQESTTLKPDVTSSTRLKSSSSHQTVGHSVETTSKQNSESGSKGSDQMIAAKTVPIGAIAGGIVGILVVSLTVISLIMCRRRRVCMFQQKNNHSNMSNTYVDVSNTTSSNVKRPTDTDVNGSKTVNNAIYSGNFDADLVYSKEEAPQISNKTDTDSSLECYDHLHVYDKRETRLSENLYSSNVGFRSNTDPTYDYSTMGTTQRKDNNSIYDHTMESMNSSNVGFRNKTDPTYDDSTMCTIQGKDTNNIYDHILENMDSTCSDIDDVYAVSSKLKPAK